MSSYILTTDKPNLFLIAIGDDAEDAKLTAEQTIQLHKDVKLTGMQEITHSVAVSLDVTILSRTSSDEVLLNKLTEQYKDRAKIEIHNDLIENDGVRKRFRVDDEKEVTLILKNKEEVKNYTKNGLSDAAYATLLEHLDQVLREIHMTETAEDAE